MTNLRISEAAALLGVSDDTVRRWIDTGRFTAVSDAGGPLTIPGAQVAAAMAEHRVSDPDAPPQSARNRFPGIVTRVERDGIMALVEIQAGPHRIISLMSREAADELELEPGKRAAAVVKATQVVVDTA
jgi:molybdopterin-binding protein